MSEEIDVRTCGECGIRWGAPAEWWKARQEDKRTFYCPNGHSRVFHKSEADRLAEELSRTKQQLAERDDTIRRQRELREAAERSAAAARGQVTKLKKRASAGVCPCCNRTFLALGKHMAQKHPGFLAEPIDGANVVALKKPA